MNILKFITKNTSYWFVLIGLIQLFYSFYLGINAESRTDELTSCFHVLGAGMMFLLSHVVSIYKELTSLRKLSILNAQCVHVLDKKIEVSDE